MKLIELYGLTRQFYTDNAHLKEMMRKENRPYGVVIISYHSLRFAIPLRSHIKHKFAFFTAESKGPDYSKALFIAKLSYISKGSFSINEGEFITIQQDSKRIKMQFERYVDRYRKAIKERDDNILKNYKYSTLINYHNELDLI